MLYLDAAKDSNDFRRHCYFHDDIILSLLLANQAEIPVREYGSKQENQLDSDQENQLDSEQHSEPDSDYCFYDNDSLRIETEEEDFVEEISTFSNKKNEAGKKHNIFITGNCLLRRLQTCMICIFFLFLYKDIREPIQSKTVTVPFAFYERRFLTVGSLTYMLHVCFISSKILLGLRFYLEQHKQC